MEQPSSGSYTAIGHDRILRVPGGRATPSARLTSYHETLHGFLNGSTAFGNAMILGGSLAQAGQEAFAGMVASMADASRLTHESFATLASLCTATGGGMDETLLQGEYLDLLHMFRHVFGQPVRPFLAVVALTSCARAAMQTEIYGTLMDLPCEAWPEASFAKPDQRFKGIYRRDNADAAMAAIDRVLEGAGEAGQRLVRGVEPDVEHRLTVEVGAIVQEAMSQASFEVYAAALETAGYGPRPAYDAQRTGLGKLVEKVARHAGTSLKTELRVASGGVEGDLDALLSDHRRETLELRDEPDPAMVDDGPGGMALLDRFRLAGPDGPYVQLVGMPRAKLLHLYRIVGGAEALERTPGATVSALRRAGRMPDGSAGVALHVLRQPDLSSLVGDGSFTGVLAIPTTSALADPAWRAEWVTPGAGPIVRLPVLIDTDPFELVRRHSGRASVRVTVGAFRRHAGDDGHVETFCMAVADMAEVVFFTPCSTPFRQALVEFGRRNCPGVTLSPRLAEGWDDLLGLALGHVLREERRFGAEFWM